MNKTKLIATGYALLALLSGATRQYIEPGADMATSDLPFLVAGISLMFIWYYFDSEQIQYERSILLNIGIITIGVIAFPYYFFKSRGLKKGLIYTGFLLLVIISWSAFDILGAHLIYYGVQS